MARWFLLTTWCVLTAAWAEPPADVDPHLWDQLQKLEDRRGAVEDLSARFVQERFTPLLRKPIRSEGTVRLKSTQMRWEVLEPTRSVVHLSDAELRIYLPEDRLVEVYPAQSRAGWTWGLAPEAEALARAGRLERLDADADECAVRMTPRDEAMRRHVDHMDITLDVASGLVRRVKLVEGEGNVTVITFADMAINTGLKDEDVALVLPDDVTISRPLGEREPSPSSAE